jgi:hypothetical protein
LKIKAKIALLFKYVAHRSYKYNYDLMILFDFWCLNISAISWRPVLVVEEAGVPGDNHRPWASN